MSQFLKKFGLFCAVLFALTSPAMAQDGDGEDGAGDAGSKSLILTTLGAGLVVIGAGFGIGKLSSAAFESMARQPEVAGDIRGAMVIVAAMVEGAAVIGLVVCMMQKT